MFDLCATAFWFEFWFSGSMCLEGDAIV